MFDFTSQKPSTLIDRFFPEQYREDGTLFVEFVKAFFKWGEQQGNFEHAKSLLRAIRDIDEVEARYLDYHHGENLTSLPTSSAADRRLLAKNIVSFYRSRGSVDSYHTLFRMVYGANVEIYLPYNDTLIASGSQWYVEKALRTTAAIGNPFDLVDKDITGSATGATAHVDGVFSEILSGVQYYRLVISNVRGTFQANEVALTSDNAIGVLTQSFATQLVLDNGDPLGGGGGAGVYHRVDDQISLVSSLSGFGGTAKVLGVDNHDALEVAISYGGDGYTIGNTHVTITGGTGQNAAARVTALSNTRIMSLNNQFVNAAATTVLNVANYGTPFTHVPTNANTVLSVALRFATMTVGRISRVSMSNYGRGYANTLGMVAIARDPVVVGCAIEDPNHAGQYYGNNAILTPRNANGVITSLRIDQFGNDYVVDESLVLQNLSRSAVNAVAVYTGQTDPVLVSPGYYVTNRGHLSTNKYLQDNDYYQKFSYELRSSLALEDYQDIVNKMLHPAGTKLFGRLVITDVVQVPVTTVLSVEQKSTGTGYLRIPGNTSISFYEANSQFTIGSIELVRATDWGSNAFVIGTGTIFQSQIANGQYIKIVPTLVPTANASVQTRTIASNTVLTLQNFYPFGRVANATFGVFI